MKIVAAVFTTFLLVALLAPPSTALACGVPKANPNGIYAIPIAKSGNRLVDKNTSPVWLAGYYNVNAHHFDVDSSHCPWWKNWLDLMAENGINLVRIWVDQDNELSSTTVPDEPIWESQMSWPFSGSLEPCYCYPCSQTTVCGVNLCPSASWTRQFNLSSLSQTYFERVYDFVAYARDSGILVEITAFNPWAVRTDWECSMWNPEHSNMNSAVGRSDIFQGASTTWDTYVKPIQDAYLTYLLNALDGQLPGRTTRLDNVIIELDNEEVTAGSNPDGLWMDHMAGIVNTYSFVRSGFNRGQAAPPPVDLYTFNCGGRDDPDPFSQGGCPHAANDNPPTRPHAYNENYADLPCPKDGSSLRKAWYHYYSESGSASAFMFYYDFLGFNTTNGCTTSSYLNCPDACALFEDGIASGGAFLANLYRLSDVNDIAPLTGAYIGSGSATLFSASTNGSRTEELLYVRDIGTSGTIVTPLLGGTYRVEYRDTDQIGPLPANETPFGYSTIGIQSVAGFGTIPFAMTATYDLAVVVVADSNAPVITGVSPNPVCSPASPSSVTINGLNLNGTSNVLIGGTPVTIQSVSGSAVVVATPALNPGSYTVTLVKPGIATQLANGITYVTPTANWTSNPLPPVDGKINPPPSFTVQFFVPSTLGATYAWTFGDGGTSALQNPSHPYTTAGLFDVNLTVTVPNACSVSLPRTQYVRIHDSALVENFIVGLGPGQANNNIVAGFTYSTTGATITPAMADFPAYSAGAWGTNVAAGRIDPCYPNCTNNTVSASILTGPGPGGMFGPQVRGFFKDGSPRGKINYYAYSTLRYGVNVSKGDVDGDNPAEILTGPGRGEVFGPHVRGWNFDNVSISAIDRISFFAYSTLKYGVNVTSGNIENADDCVGNNCNVLGYHDEIVTGAGPGAVFGPHVRGFRFRPNLIPPYRPYAFLEATPMSLFAYSTGVYGVEVAGGFFGDPTANYTAADEVVTGRGPDPSTNPNTADTMVRVFRYPNQAVTSTTISLPTSDPSAFGVMPYGTTVGTGDLDGDTKDEILVGVSAHPNSPVRSRITGRRIDFTTVPPNSKLQRLAPDLDFLPYGPVPNFGVTVAAAQFDEKFRIAQQQEIVSTDAQLTLARDFVAGIPDSKTMCDSCDPKLLQLAGTEWGADSQKQAVLEKLDLLLAVLPDLAEPGQVVNRLNIIEDLASNPVLGIQNEMALAELKSQLAHIKSFYDPPAFPSNAVTARLPGFETPDKMALAFSEPTGTLFVRPLSVDGVLHTLDVNTLAKGEDRPFPSGAPVAEQLAVPAGRPLVYAATYETAWYNGCWPAYCPVRVRLCRLERFSPSGWLPRDSGYKQVARVAGAGAPTALAVTPPAGATSLRPNTAWMAVFTGVLQLPPDRLEVGALYRVSNVEDFDDAVVTPIDIDIPGGSPVYRALQPTPLPGEDALYALREDGVDVIRTADDALFPDQLSLPSGFGPATWMTAGTTAGGKSLLYVGNADEMLVYDATTRQIVPGGEVTLPGYVVDAHVSLDGRYLLLTRYPGAEAQSLLVLDADTFQRIRDSDMTRCEPGVPCLIMVAGAEPMALTIDGSHAIVSTPNEDELKYVYLQPARLVVVGTTLERVIAAVPPELFVVPDGQQTLLDMEAAAQQHLENAEHMPNGNARDQQLTNADRKLEQMMTKYDGCSGGNPNNDFLHDCDEQGSLTNVTRQLMRMIEAELPPTAPSTP